MKCITTIQNAFDTSGYRNTAKYTEGKTAAGTDYYYTYGNTLFIVLEHKQLQLCNSRKCYA